MIRSLVAMLILLPLCGCIADQKRQTASCALEAMRMYPNDTLTGNNPSYRMADYVQTCMTKAGYDFKCDPYFSLSSIENCYEPSSQGGKWAYHAERWLEAHGL